MIVQYDDSYYDKLIRFMISEVSNVECKDIINYIDTKIKRRAIFYLYLEDEVLAGVSGFRKELDGNVYTDILHVDTRLSSYKQMKILVKLLSNIEEYAIKANMENVFVLAVNLYKQLHRRGYSLYSEVEGRKTFVKKVV